MSSLQVFMEPVKHVSKSLFSTFDCKWVRGIISASKSVGNSWEDLDKVFNLQERKLRYVRYWICHFTHLQVHQHWVPLNPERSQELTLSFLSLKACSNWRTCSGGVIVSFWAPRISIGHLTSVVLVDMVSTRTHSHQTQNTMYRPNVINREVSIAVEGNTPFISSTVTYAGWERTTTFISSVFAISAANFPAS